MDDEQPQDGKVKTSVSLDKHYVDRMEDLIKRKRFVSKSGLIEAALAEFFGHLDEREAHAKPKEALSQIDKLFKAYLETEEGRKFLKNMKSKNNNNELNDDINRYADFE